MYIPAGVRCKIARILGVTEERRQKWHGRSDESAREEAAEVSSVEWFAYNMQSRIILTVVQLQTLLIDEGFVQDGTTVRPNRIRLPHTWHDH